MSEVAKQINTPDQIPMVLTWAADMARRGLSKGPVVLRLGRPKRSLEQNDKFWAMMTDLAAQVDWYGRKLSKEEWRNVLTAAMKRQEVVPNLDGNGFVVLGARTRDMSKEEMALLIDLAQHFGDGKGVAWKGSI